MPNEATNELLESCSKEFIELFKKRANMEKNFSGDMLEDYTNIDDKVNELAANLLKYGCRYEKDEDYFHLLIHNEKYTVSLDKIIQYLSDTELSVLVSKKKQQEHQNGNKIACIKDKEKNPLYKVFMAMAEAFDEGNVSPTTLVPYKPETTLLDDINALQKRVILFEQEGAAAIEECKKHENEILVYKKNIEDVNVNLKNKIDEIKNLNRKNEELANKLKIADDNKEERKKSYNNMKNELFEVKKDLEKANAQIKNKDNELNPLKAKIESVNNQLKENEATIKNLENEIQQREAICESLRKQINESNNNVVSESNSSYEEEIQHLQQKLHEYKEKNEKQRQEMVILNEKIAYYKELEEKIDYYKEMEEKVEHFKQLAITDRKYEIKNNNAFEIETAEIDKDKYTITIVGICGMKAFNTAFGRDKGDIRITKVCDVLKESFGYEYVYRIEGDHFAILTDNISSDQMKDKFNEIQKILKPDVIEIVYGSVDCITCTDLASAKRQAESSMKQMKLRTGKDILTQKNIESMKRKKKELTNKSEKVQTEPEPATEDYDILTRTEIRNLNEPTIDMGDIEANNVESEKDDDKTDDDEEDDIDFEEMLNDSDSDDEW